MNHVFAVRILDKTNHQPVTEYETAYSSEESPAKVAWHDGKADWHTVPRLNDAGVRALLERVSDGDYSWALGICPRDAGLVVVDIDGNPHREALTPLLDHLGDPCAMVYSRAKGYHLIYPTDETDEDAFCVHGKAVKWQYAGLSGDLPVSYTHLTLPTNREV